MDILIRSISGLRGIVGSSFNNDVIISHINAFLSLQESGAILVARDGRPHGKNYLDIAIRAAEFLWANMWAESGCLLRIYNNGESKINGCLEDYAYFLEGLISLYEASFDTLWIKRANNLALKMIDEFYDKKEGGFFITGISSERLIARLKNAADEAIPSANAIAIQSLLKLGYLTGNNSYIAKAEKSLRGFKGRVDKNPSAFSGLLAGADLSASSLTEVFANLEIIT